MTGSFPPETVMRSVTRADASSLVSLIEAAGAGLASMPRDVVGLSAVLASSEAGDRPTFVLERQDTGELVGVCSIIAALPDASYSVTCEVRREADGRTWLRPHKRFVGFTDLCTLFVLPEMRGGGSGRLLSLGRFFAIASSPGRFSEQLVVQFRGVLDEQGVSPLWQAVCDRVLQIDHVTAHRHLREDPSFLGAQLSADGWLDLSALPEPVLALLGRVNQNAEPARRLLDGEGFSDTGDVDLLDAGPVLSCVTREARIVRESRLVEVTAVVDTDAPREMLIATAGQGPLRCCRGVIDAAGRLAEPSARALGVEVGMSVRYASVRPT